MSEGSKTLNSGEAMSCPSMKSCKGHLHVNITKFKFELIVKGKKVRKQAEFETGNANAVGLKTTVVELRCP